MNKTSKSSNKVLSPARIYLMMSRHALMQTINQAQLRESLYSGSQVMTLLDLLILSTNEEILRLESAS